MPLDPNDPIAVLLAVYGEPRETKDADLAMAGVVPQECLGAMRAAGLDASLALESAIFGGLLISRVTPFGSEPGVNTADLVEPRSRAYALRALGRSLPGTLRGAPVRVLAPEDFVLFKALSTRERDVEDAAAVVRLLGSRLDRALVQDEVSRIAAEVADHDVRGRLGPAMAG